MTQPAPLGNEISTPLAGVENEVRAERHGHAASAMPPRETTWSARYGSAGRRSGKAPGRFLPNFARCRAVRSSEFRPDPARL